MFVFIRQLLRFFSWLCYTGHRTHSRKPCLTLAGCYSAATHGLFAQDHRIHSGKPCIFPAGCYLGACSQSWCKGPQDTLLETLFLFCKLPLSRFSSWLGCRGTQNIPLEDMLFFCKLLLRSFSSCLSCTRTHDTLLETLILFCMLMLRSCLGFSLHRTIGHALGSPASLL